MSKQSQDTSTKFKAGDIVFGKNGPRPEIWVIRINKIIKNEPYLYDYTILTGNKSSSIYYVHYLDQSMKSIKGNKFLEIMYV